MTVPAIELKGISKSFGPVQANKDISISVAPGTIHGIIGENGAGKSTLMSILYGFYKADKGEIWINGKKTEIPDSQAAIAAGIGMVFQHFKLVENFTVLENIILGAEDGGLLKPSLAKARRTLAELAAEYELNVDPDAVIEEIGVGMQQRVEILKSLYRQAEILILDEPTGVLTPAEADQLFRILHRLKDEGKTIILITHKLREIMEATDTVSVMRRGEMTATVKTAETSPEHLAELMVGRKVLLRVDKVPAQPGKPILEIENLRVVDDKGVERVKGIDLTVRAGEILGIAGVAGNGQSELLEVLGGMRPGSGVVKFKGQSVELGTPEISKSKNSYILDWLTGIIASFIVATFFYPDSFSVGVYEWGQLAGAIFLTFCAFFFLPKRFANSLASKRRELGIGHVPEDRQREGLIMEFHAWENVAFGYHHDPAYQSGIFMNNAALRADTDRKIEKFDVRPADSWLAAKNFSGGNQQKIVVAREIERNPDLLLVGQPTRGVDIGALEFIHKQIVALRDQGKAVLLVSVELEEIFGLADRIAVMFDGHIMGERLPHETNEKELGLLMAGVNGEAA
ncbi:ABC transporter ATP-binding protein [Ruegeria pomeroyi]|uniref:ABC transporter ATP-binding protein n=1 Tax=Ruegeria pomeroyi TaxID=89184 RepID=UPI001F385B5E|nr:ABC transporter ATP-binding protein [Ruegeria pomeroyi]